jgi:hypothetical protein
MLVANCWLVLVTLRVRRQRKAQRHKAQRHKARRKHCRVRAVRLPLNRWEPLVLRLLLKALQPYRLKLALVCQVYRRLLEPPLHRQRRRVLVKSWLPPELGLKTLFLIRERLLSKSAPMLKKTHILP